LLEFAINPQRAQSKLTMQDLNDANHEHRRQRRVNLAAGLFLVCLIGLAIWTVKLFTDQEKLQRCLDSRRTNCFDVEQRPAGEIRLPAH
jgi:hypothetical protein